MQTLRGTGDGELGHPRATQGPVQKVGHEQQCVGGGEQVGMRPLMGEQLKERVELHELQSGLGEDGFAGHAAKRFFHDAVSAGVAVGKRLAQQFPAFIQQHVIHAPGIRADGDNAGAVLLRGEGQSVLDFVPEPQHVPAQAVGKHHRAVGETMDFFELEGFAVPPAGHHPSALGAEINGQIDLVGFHKQTD
ncbi:MAG: hypothetical protein BWX84_02049 [Verrucomicrobia bacterium ADurb.Bin118]|nr:MAG: hypothetical protein BWX84_02049 [Verrucomicrobia bacterium ADurb.Bin118]